MHLQLHISFLSVQESELLFQGSFQNSGLKHSTSGANQSQRLIKKKRYMKVRWGFNLESQETSVHIDRWPPSSFRYFLHSLDISTYTQHIFPFFNNNLISHALLLLFVLLFEYHQILVSIAGCEASSYKLIVPISAFPATPYLISACLFLTPLWLSRGCLSTQIALLLH